MRFGEGCCHPALVAGSAQTPSYDGVTYLENRHPHASRCGLSSLALCCSPLKGERFYARSQAGFSLIQLSIIITIAAMVLAVSLPGGDKGSEVYRKSETLDKMDIILDALTGFKATYQRLPCPAEHPE